MKNCLILAGEFRTFEKTADTIVNFINANNLDVYCHLWSNNEKEYQKIVDTLKPKQIKCKNLNDNSEFLNIEARIKKKFLKGPNSDKLWQNASMHYGRKEAYNLVPKDTYDNIIFSRYDLAFLTNFTINQSLNSVKTSVAESWGLISDVFAVMPYKYAKHFFLYEEFEKLHSTPFEQEFIDFLLNDFKYGKENTRIHAHERYCPHMILIRNFFLNKVPWELEEYPVALYR
ncbi:MAG: hypothetical protein RLZZ479_243 [Bacteroidota bacterium]|jgi:hypothetical protein